MKILLALLLSVSCVQAKDFYRIHPLSEKDIQQTYIQLLRDACHYADRDWKPAPFDSTAGYWGDGVSSGNEGIRTISDMVLASATLIKYDKDFSDAQRKDLFDKAVAALRFIVQKYRTGTQKCMNGKP